MIYDHISTDYDAFHELYVCGAELTEEGFPILKPYIGAIPEMSADFVASKKVKVGDCRKTNVNFYLDDQKFSAIWTDFWKYENYFKGFHSICGFDFTIDQCSPLVLQKWNKYRNMALSSLCQRNGINVIPNVNVLSDAGDFIYDGLPTGSVLSCSTNGRTQKKMYRTDFCKGFYQMCERLKPKHVIIIGREVPELETDVPITYFDTTSMKRQALQKENEVL